MHYYTQNIKFALSFADANCRVIATRKEQLRIVQACHEGIGETKNNPMVLIVEYMPLPFQQPF